MWGYILVIACVAVLFVVLVLLVKTINREIKRIELPVKNIQPEMNKQRQTRKAVAEITGYLLEKDLDRAYYALNLLNMMLDTFKEGQPQPWSEFQPQIAEEFG